MDSPDAHSKAAATSSPAIKDSPFSAYISSLSPIPQVQTGPGFLSYGDINFPSPEPVFRSPHIRQKKLDVLRSSEKHCMRNTRDDTACSRDAQMDKTFVSSSTFQPTLGIENKSEGNQSPEKLPSCSSPCVDLFLADPSENNLNDSGSPELCSMQTEDASQVMDGISASITANQVKCNHNEYANSQTIEPLSSAAMSEIIADNLRNDLLGVQLNQDTPRRQTLLDDCACTQENIVEIQHSEMHKHICDTDRLISSSKAENGQCECEESAFAENVQSRLKEGNQFEESYEMPHDEQLEVVSRDTNISRASTENERNLVDQKTQVPPFQSMDLPDETRKSSSSHLHDHDGMCPDISGSPESDELGQNSKSIQGPPSDDQVVEKFIIPSENQTPYDEEASQHQYAMRKRLQFETAENTKQSHALEKQVSNFKSNLSDAEPTKNLMDKNTLHTLIVEPTEAFSSKQLIQSAVTAGVSCQKKDSSHVTVRRPFAIGLHLNTLGSIGQASCTDMQLIQKDICEGETPLSGAIDQVVQASKDQLPSVDLTSDDSMSLSASKDKEFLDNAGDDNDVIFDGGDLNKELSIYSVSYQALLDAGNFQCSLPTEHADRYLTPCNLKRLHADNTTSMLSTQSSSRKKRKKGTNVEGQKRCSCKRSKCLKLYCDCFAAGAVCTEACGCHECLNKPEHEDTILETRKQIESRNPLAFAPKVILRACNPSDDNEENMGSTPSSARHKRGCNCKKSLCLKKYCECFQAGVGCSIGCRCEGCKNTFGQKDGSSECIEIKHQKPKEDNCDKESSVTKFDGTLKRDVAKAERHLRLSPLTPSIQCPNGSGTDIHKPLLNLSYLASPESSASLLPVHGGSPSSQIRSIGDITFENDTEELNSLVPHGQAWDYDRAGKAEAMLSPGWDGFEDILLLSPLVGLSPGTTDSSVASKTTGTKISQSKLSQGGYSRAIVGPLQWHYSPVTPLPQLGESKVLPDPDTSSGVHKDPGKGTLEVLNVTPLSVGAVQSNSPRQKRVVSPRKQTTQTKSISSPGLRNTRKFILKSVPSFPPLTPCSNERDDAT